MLHLIDQLDQQLYARLYAIAPLSFEGRFRLFAFSYATCIAACLEEGQGADAAIERKLASEVLVFLRRHRDRFFAEEPEPEALRRRFVEQAGQYKLDWGVAASRLEGSQRAQAHAVIRHAFNAILGDDPSRDVDDPRIMAQVHDLVGALSRIREAFA